MIASKATKRVALRHHVKMTGWEEDRTKLASVATYPEDLIIKDGETVQLDLPPIKTDEKAVVMITYAEVLYRHGIVSGPTLIDYAHTGPIPLRFESTADLTVPAGTPLARAYVVMV